VLLFFDKRSIHKNIEISQGFKMSVISFKTSQQAHNFISTNLTQAGQGPERPLILQMPRDILNLFASWVATGSNPQELAKNAIQLGRVCTYTHHLSHGEEMEIIIDKARIDVATHDLAKAIFERGMIGPDIGSPKRLGDKQKSSMERKNLNALYTIFKEYASKYNIKENSDEFANQSITISLNIRTLCQRLEESVISYDVANKINSALGKFAEKTIESMIAEYANQPLEEITIENFKEKALYFKAPFAEIIKPIFIERKMRQAIVAKHGPEEFNIIINALFISAENAFVTQLEEEKETLEDELFYLRGPNGFDGAIMDAYQKKEDSEAANNRFIDLVARLTKIAVFNSDNCIIAGRLVEIEDSIKKIDRNYDLLQKLHILLAEKNTDAAELAVEKRNELVDIPGFNIEIAKIYKFYNELSNSQLPRHLAVLRGLTLHRIIN
jgi:hypothetical protein